MAEPDGKAPEVLATPIHASSTASAESEATHPAIERLLLHEEHARRATAGADEPQRAPRAPAPGLTVGALLEITAQSAVVSVDGTAHDATLGAHVDPAFLKLALASGEPVLLQQPPSGPLLVLGVIQGKHPTKLVGQRVEITAETEVVVKSGKSALRLRQDGVVDLIGARISASSRGLLRLVGRALRLN